MELSHESLQKILESSSIENLSIAEVENLFLKEKQVYEHAPRGQWEIDPRNGDRVVYNASRRKRPHDNLRKPAREESVGEEAGSEESARENPGESSAGDDCFICRGKTTGVLDVAALSEGFTFINKNLYPAVYPQQNRKDIKGAATGLHFLQWTSSIHGNDWHNMNLDDCFVVMKRLAALEGFLIGNGGVERKSREGESSEENNFRIDMPVEDIKEGKGRYVIIIKNYGKPVGGSLSHGHQQILYTNIIPRALKDDMVFWKEHGETFSSYIKNENPASLTVKDYGNAVLFVPFFMKRPYHMILSFKSPGKTFLHELDRKELESAAKGWHDAALAIVTIMPELGRETAYNIVTHNSPGGGLYFEFLPYTQELGGLEKLGFYICEEEPLAAAGILRGILNDR